MVDYVRDPTPHDNFGEGSATWVVWAHTWLVKSLSFFSFFLSFFCFLQRMPRSHFLTDRNDLYAKTRVSGQGCAFSGSRQYQTTFRGLNPKNSSKWAGIGISYPNRQSSKIASHRWRYSRQISQTDWLQGHSLKYAKLGQIGSTDREGVTWSTIWILGPPLYLGNGWS